MRTSYQIATKLALLLITNLAFSQEIKIKKGKVMLDNTEVAIIEKKKLIYTFSTLNNEPKFSVELKSRDLLDGTTAYWCILTDLLTNKTNEIQDKGSYSGLSFEKTIVSSVVHGDKKFITPNGIDEKLVTEFINGERSNVLKSFDDMDFKTISEFLTEKKNLDNLKIRVEKSTILQKQKITDADGNTSMKDIVVGYIDRAEETTIQGFPPNVYYAIASAEMLTNQNGKKQEIVKPVAKWYKTKTGYDNPVTGKKIKEQIITIDNKSFNLPEIHPDNSATALKSAFGKPDEAKLKEAIVAKLIFNGYTFGKPIE